MDPTPETLSARRNARFAEEWVFMDDETPFNFTGYSGALEVRQYGAQAGTAILALSNVTSDSEGVWVRDPVHGTIAIRIDQATLEAAYDALADGIEPGAPLTLVYDLILTAPSGAEEAWMEGEFIIKPGAVDV